ncbi:MAG TPA: hypothetical protein PL045_11155, partial [Chitinophagaceae bacterium]|nr:hypothetical protein [Chitinophagaceae bacterium]
MYLLKAYVHERIGPTPDKNLNEENRKALAFIEMALLNDAKSLVRVKTAARLFSNLGLDINAFGLSGESAEINKSDFEVQEEYVRSLLNKGDYDLAETLLPRLYELNPTGKELYDGWKAYSLYMRSAENPSLLSEAIELTERKVIKDKDDLWTHFLLLHAYWLNGNTTKALQQADWIAGIENNDNYNSKNTELAFAYFVKGDVKKALAYNSSAKKIPENMPGALLDSTCYLIADNNLEDAKKDFAKLDDAVLKKSEIKNYIRYFVIIAERYSRDNKNAAAIQSLVHDKETGFIALLNKKLQTAKEEADPVNEINSFLDKPGYEEGSWGWFALQLSLFRHFVIRKKYAAALDCFTSVMNDSRSADYILTWNNAADFINAAVVKQQNFADAYSQVNSLDKKIYPADVISIISSRLMDMLHDKLKTKNKITWQLPV